MDDWTGQWPLLCRCLVELRCTLSLQMIWRMLTQRLVWRRRLDMAVGPPSPASWSSSWCSEPETRCLCPKLKLSKKISSWGSLPKNWWHFEKHVAEPRQSESEVWNLRFEFWKYELIGVVLRPLHDSFAVQRIMGIKPLWTAGEWIPQSSSHGILQGSRQRLSSPPEVPDSHCFLQSFPFECLHAWLKKCDSHWMCWTTSWYLYEQNQQPFHDSCWAQAAVSFIDYNIICAKVCDVAQRFVLCWPEHLTFATCANLRESTQRDGVVSDWDMGNISGKTFVKPVLRIKHNTWVLTGNYDKILSNNMFVHFFSNTHA